MPQRTAISIVLRRRPMWLLVLGPCPGIQIALLSPPECHRALEPWNRGTRRQLLGREPTLRDLGTADAREDVLDHDEARELRALIASRIAGYGRPQVYGQAIAVGYI